MVDRFTRKNITKDQLLANGVNLTVEKAYMTTEKTIHYYEELVQCKNSDSFCLPPSYKFNVFGRADVSHEKGEAYQRIAVTLETCSSKNVECEQYQDNLIFYVLKRAKFKSPSKF